LQLSLQASSPETFGYTLVFSVIVNVVYRKARVRYFGRVRWFNCVQDLETMEMKLSCCTVMMYWWKMRKFLDEMMIVNIGGLCV